MKRVLGMIVLLSVSVLSLTCDEDNPATPITSENLPPTAYVAVVGDSTTRPAHQVDMLWWGADRDGEIIGYAYRWSSPWIPETRDSLWWEDSSWVFTSASRDTFDLPVATSSAAFTFEVHAIDDQGLASRDAARETFTLTNETPTLAWADSSALPSIADTTLPVVLFQWIAQDRDGLHALSHTRLWLDVLPGEDSASAAVDVPAPGTSVVISPAQFQGRYGSRTINVQTFDVNSLGSEPISWTWNVELPEGDYLVIDNAGEYIQGPTLRHDYFWRAVIERTVGENYHVYDVWEEGVFESQGFAQTLFGLFEGVVWYGGPKYDGSLTSDQQMSQSLHVAQGALREYTSQGGGMIISGHNTVGDGGGLSDDFLEEVVGVSEIFAMEEGGESTTNLDLPRRTVFSCGASFGGTDSLRLQSTVRDAELFRMSAQGSPILWIQQESLSLDLEPPPDPGEALHLGVSIALGNRRLVVFSTILSNFYDPDEENESADVIASMVRDAFGL